MSEDYIILHKQDPKLPKIRLFILFMWGDNRIPDGFNWSLSIDSKIKAVDVLFNEVLSQIPKCFEELEEIRKRGFGGGVECLKLAIKYEVFLNSIYSLCENLSRIVAYLYRERNLPQSFNAQRNRFLKKPDIDPDFTKILANITWWDEVHSIRSESVHYLSGFITISSATELGYFNRPQSRRNGAPTSILIDNIEKHIRQLYNNVKEFLLEFGEHFIKNINQDAYIALPCLRTSSGLIGIKGISLKGYLNNDAGICLTPDFDCPLKETCGAHREQVKNK